MPTKINGNVKIKILRVISVRRRILRISDDTSNNIIFTSTPKNIENKTRPW
jgi:hypothetical protein